MTELEWVELVGGHFDGETVQVDPYENRLLLKWIERTVPRMYDVERQVPQLGLSSYRRVDRKTFLHCRTPTHVGDTDLAFPEAQLTLEAEDDD